MFGTAPLFFALGTLFVFHAIQGYSKTMFKNLINLHYDSPIRAIILSLHRLIIPLGFDIFGPTLGMLSVKFDLNVALLLASLF